VIPGCGSGSRIAALALLLGAQTALADFGTYQNHALVGQALIVQTHIG